MGFEYYLSFKYFLKKCSCKNITKIVLTFLGVTGINMLKNAPGSHTRWEEDIQQTGSLNYLVQITNSLSGYENSSKTCQVFYLQVCQCIHLEVRQGKEEVSVTLLFRMMIMILKRISYFTMWVFFCIIHLNWELF